MVFVNNQDRGPRSLHQGLRGRALKQAPYAANVSMSDHNQVRRSRFGFAFDFLFRFACNDFADYVDSKVMSIRSGHEHLFFKPRTRASSVLKAHTFRLCFRAQRGYDAEKYQLGFETSRQRDGNLNSAFTFRSAIYSD